MKTNGAIATRVSGQFAALLLASVMSFPALAQNAQPAGNPQDTPPAAQVQDNPPTAQAQETTGSHAITPAKEGFWGRVNPFARKKWVKKQTDPINDRLTELDGVNAKNSRDIQDVDGRAQSGIRNAQSAADQANQTATAAGSQAQKAGMTAQNAANHVDQLNGTVNGLDQYHQVTEAEVKFHAGSVALSADAKKQLDDLATSVQGQKGYILEVEAHAPGAGSVGIQNSARMADAVKRYLTTQHEIPVYRMHAVALGNAKAVGDEDAKPVRTSTVHIRLMENSLAAQGAAPPQGAASLTGAERP